MSCLPSCGTCSFWQTKSLSPLHPALVPQLKAKDDEYVKSLKRQADDVDLLVGRMVAQFKSLRKTFDEELEEIETAFMQERAELKQSNQQELASLMQKRLDKEEQYMDARRRRVDEDQRQLEAQRVQVHSSRCLAPLSACHFVVTVAPGRLRLLRCCIHAACQAPARLASLPAQIDRQSC